jgi:hypothetical protein
LEPKEPELLWPLTESGCLHPQPTSLNDARIIQKCTASILQDDYVVQTGGFVLFNPFREHTTLPHVGCIVEIFANAHRGHLIGMLVQEHDVGDVVLPYRFPSLSWSSTGPVFCKVKV